MDLVIRIHTIFNKMKKIFIIIAFLLVQKTNAQLSALINNAYNKVNTLLPDNINQLITPLKHRRVDSAIIAIGRYLDTATRFNLNTVDLQRVLQNGNYAKGHSLDIEGGSYIMSALGGNKISLSADLNKNFLLDYFGRTVKLSGDSVLANTNIQFYFPSFGGTLATRQWVNSLPTYILPIATATSLGGVKVGSGLSINSSGVLSATFDSTSLSNRIDGKLNISDTAAMLEPYRHWLAGYTPQTRTIATTLPLQGGGDLSVNRTLSIDTSLINQYNIRTFGTQSAWGTKIFKEKLYVGGADSLFENDPYVTQKNTFKIGGVLHQYGIADSGKNGGMDYTFFKENGDSNGNRTPVISNRRVLPGQEIAYHQYSAHNGVDNIYSVRSIAAIIAAQPSYNSRLGDLHGWLSFITAKDSGFKTTPNIDFVLTEGKSAFNAPINLRNSDLLRTMTVYGSARATDTLLSSVINVGTNLNLYKNGSDLCYRNTGSSFDVLKFRENTRPVVIQGGASHLPLYMYTDAGGAGFIVSASQLSGVYVGTAAGNLQMADVNVLRWDNVAGARVGVNTGSGNNATLDVRGSTSSTRAFLVKNNASTELFTVREAGNINANHNLGNFLIGSSTDASNGKLQVTGNISVTGIITLGAITIMSGTGTPEGTITATVGSLFMRTDGGASSTMYVKESGSGNTGWVAK